MTSQLLISMTADIPNAQLFINGQAACACNNTYNLQDGINNIAIRVSFSGNDQSYELIVFKAAAKVAGGDVTLSSLSINFGTLMPSFSPSIFDYDVAVDASIASIILTAVPTDTSATCAVHKTGVIAADHNTNSLWQILNSTSVNGNSAAIGLQEGVNIVRIRVTASDGVTYQNYVIAISRPRLFAQVTNLNISTGVLTPAFSPDNYNYEVRVQSSISTFSIAAEADASFALRLFNCDISQLGGFLGLSTGTLNIQSNMEMLVSGQSSSSVQLQTGANFISLVVQPSTTFTMTTAAAVYYSILVSRPPPVHVANTDANLHSLMLDSYAMKLLTPFFSSSTLDYSLSVQSMIANISFVAIASDEKATLWYRVGYDSSFTSISSSSMNGSFVALLNPGINDIMIRVVAEDNITTRNYHISCMRAVASAQLMNLVLSSGELVPTFSPFIRNYSCTVSSATTTFSLNVWALDASASISVRIGLGDFVGVMGGHPSPALFLNYGWNAVMIAITSSDGSITRTYTINVFRRPVLTDAHLAAISLSVGQLQPIFDSKIFSYFVFLKQAVSTFTITSSAVLNTQTNITINNVPCISGQDVTFNLTSGYNNFSIAVVAPDMTTTLTYQLYVFVQQQAQVNATAVLSSISLSNASLTPAFSSSIFTYTSTVDFSMSFISMGLGSMGGCTCFVSGANNWQMIASPGKMLMLPLTVGSNSYSIRVVAADSISYSFYYLTVIRMDMSMSMQLKVDFSYAMDMSSTVFQSQFKSQLAIAMGVDVSRFSMFSFQSFSSSSSATTIIGGGGVPVLTPPVSGVQSTGSAFLSSTGAEYQSSTGEIIASSTGEIIVSSTGEEYSSTGEVIVSSTGEEYSSTGEIIVPSTGEVIVSSTGEEYSSTGEIIVPSTGEVIVSSTGEEYSSTGEVIVSSTGEEYSSTGEIIAPSTGEVIVSSTGVEYSSTGEIIVPSTGEVIVSSTGVEYSSTGEIIMSSTGVESSSIEASSSNYFSSGLSSLLSSLSSLFSSTGTESQIVSSTGAIVIESTGMQSSSAMIGGSTTTGLSASGSLSGFQSGNIIQTTSGSSITISQSTSVSTTMSTSAIISFSLLSAASANSGTTCYSIGQNVEALSGFSYSSSVSSSYSSSYISTSSFTITQAAVQTSTNAPNCMSCAASGAFSGSASGLFVSNQTTSTSGTLSGMYSNETALFNTSIVLVNNTGSVNASTGMNCNVCNATCFTNCCTPNPWGLSGHGSFNAGWDIVLAGYGFNNTASAIGATVHSTSTLVGFSSVLLMLLGASFF